MRRVTDANAGELVEIPKFYYKWTRDGVKMKLQISMSAFDGSHVSPAHADRGDGVGERDYVYVGRYHCSTNNWKSASGVKPKFSKSRPSARSSIHNLGSNVWQNDYAMFWTIRMLYLVEFANWNCQAMIGYGGGNGSSAENSGASDAMPYHTGTVKSDRTTYGAGVQYRYIEDMWGNAREWIDGIYFYNTNVYCIKNPANFSDASNGTLTGQRSSSGGNDNIITAWNNPNVDGFEYALYPSATNGSNNTYVCDAGYYDTGYRLPAIGGDYGADQTIGLFYLHGGYTSSFYNNTISARLMVLPSSRLAA
jgi:hypothetical protein